MNDSLTHCMNRVFLNESLEWMIHWLTVWIVCFWMNLLNEWFTDSLYESCVFEWISWMNDSLTHCMNRVFFEWISWMNDSLTHCMNRVFLNESLEWMIHWLTVWIVCFWMNLLNEWFKSSQVKLSFMSFHYMCGHIVGRDVVPHRTTVLHKYRYTTRSKTV